jgi:hypothetical protein
MRICVIDGQGGGIGGSIIKRVREIFKESVEILAVGINAIATSQMVRSGANRGASGENAIIRTVAEVDVIIGPIAITWPDAMMGEVTPRSAQAVMSATALKILLPIYREHVVIAGVKKEPLPHMIKYLVEDELREVLSRV